MLNEDLTIPDDVSTSRPFSFSTRAYLRAQLIANAAKSRARASMDEESSLRFTTRLKFIYSFIRSNLRESLARNEQITKIKIEDKGVNIIYFAIKD